MRDKYYWWWVVHLWVEGVWELILGSILAFSADKRDSIIDGYDSLETIHSGAHHVFLPAPGSSGIREALFDAVFGL